MLAAGAPVAAHWIADRQSGPALLRFGTEQQRSSILPRIAAGECCFCIGMSEAGSGSDLAAVQTRAAPSSEGYCVNGTKIWVTNAHRADFMILFCRTSGDKSARQEGTSQLLVDMKLPGITVRPIRDISGEHDFNEVHFENVRLSGDALLGQEGNGWHQVTSELVNERSGPERFLSSITLLKELIEALGADASERAAIAVGRLSAHLITLRRLSRGVAGLIEAGEDPQLQAALVKSLGSIFEQEIPEIARQLVDLDSGGRAAEEFRAVLNHTVLMAPAYSLRGGTREILRNIIARGLGLR
jgi:alkylation response protein AidB-like acyl-CoA dehydrogenase